MNRTKTSGARSEGYSYFVFTLKMSSWEVLDEVNFLLDWMVKPFQLDLKRNSFIII